MNRDDERRAIAESVRVACMDAALRSYEEAGLSGLCLEGRWECAIAAIRDLDVEPLLGETHTPDSGGT